ncbi:porin family protein [Polaribacter sp.]|uniref:porin family protein n=1 Tax=Polaribacter sp. TaxID=1920175 RepID=UPI003EF9CA14
MKVKLIFFFLVGISLSSFAQKDSLEIGTRYADDQIYLAVSYAQFLNQPSIITKSEFSYGISLGFIKDITLNTSGTVSIAAGVGYGYDFFAHKLQVEEINNATVFSSNATSTNNIYKAHNLEFPLEVRWRTSTANRYSFWRIYTGIKFLYNFSNTFQFDDENEATFKYSDVSAYNKLQYGLTISAGYDAFNIHFFYGLSPVFKDAYLNASDATNKESINTSILKFGLIFYIL